MVVPPTQAPHNQKRKNKNQIRKKLFSKTPETARVLRTAVDCEFEYFFFIILESAEDGFAIDDDDEYLDDDFDGDDEDLDVDADEEIIGPSLEFEPLLELLKYISKFIKIDDLSDFEQIPDHIWTLITTFTGH